MADKKVSDLPSLNGADVDAADLLYIVDSSAGAAGSKKITVGQYQLAPVSGGTANTVVYLNGSKVESSSSALTFDGTNLGIGTSSPGAKLEVASGKVLLSNTQSYAIKTSAGASCDVVTLTSGNVLQLGGGGATDSIQFLNQGVQRMTLDSSGNLGLGVTPSAWVAGSRALQLGSSGYTALYQGSGGESNFTNNVYLSAVGTWTAIASLGASRYQLDFGAHKWWVASSGTAGNAISFTQAMTLDAIGNLGVGVTSISGFRADILSTSTDAALRARSSNSSEVVRVESAGTSSAQIRFINTSVNNTYISAEGTALAFLTAATERARITSGGDLLVGTTGNANNYKTHILTTGAGAAIGIFQNNATTPYGINVYYGAASPNNSNANTSFLYCNDLTTLRIQLASNGGVINYQANDSNLSDRREKTDFAPAKSYLDTICAIPVQTFKYIDQTDDAPTLGVVAQDVQAAAPELVMESNWGTEDNPKMRLSIYQTDLQYALMKCIQEQQELIKDLRARVAALEAK